MLPNFYLAFYVQANERDKDRERGRAREEEEDRDMVDMVNMKQVSSTDKKTKLKKPKFRT